MKLEYLASGSPECPLVRIYDFALPEVNQFLEQIIALASGAVDRVAVHELPGVEILGECRLFLCRGRRDQAMNLASAPATFECRFTMETWDNVAGLVAPIAHGAHGFQWLAETPGAQALLLSFDGRW